MLAAKLDLGFGWGHSESVKGTVGGFPELGVPFLGTPITRTIVFWGLHGGPLILGDYLLFRHGNRVHRDSVLYQ